MKKEMTKMVYSSMNICFVHGWVISRQSKSNRPWIFLGKAFYLYMVKRTDDDMHNLFLPLGETLGLGTRNPRVVLPTKPILDAYRSRL